MKRNRFISTSPVPRWVQVVYALAQGWDDGCSRVKDWLVGWTWFRHDLMDRHCNCEPCRERRAKGRQGPLRPWWKW
jgi:hypothetical protein